MPSLPITVGTFAETGQPAALTLVTVYQKLRVLLSALAGVDAQAENQAPVYSDDVNQARLKFRLISIANLGGDEVGGKYDAQVHPAGDTYPGNLGSYIYNARGNRLLTFSILVECTYQDDRSTAYRLATAVRDKFGLPSTRQALHAAGFGFNSVTPTRDLSYDWDNREVSAAGFDLVLNAMAEAFDAPVTTIETAQIQVTAVT